MPQASLTRQALSWGALSSGVSTWHSATLQPASYSQETWKSWFSVVCDFHCTREGNGNKGFLMLLITVFCWRDTSMCKGDQWLEPEINFQIHNKEPEEGRPYTRSGLQGLVVEGLRPQKDTEWRVTVLEGSWLKGQTQKDKDHKQRLCWPHWQACTCWHSDPRHRSTGCWMLHKAHHTVTECWA